MKVRSLCLAFLLLGPAWGAALGQEGGVLPKGDLSEVDKGKAKGPEKAERKRRNCFLDLTHPPGGNGHFSPDGRNFYLLANMGDDASKKVGVARFTLYRLDMKSLKSEALLSLTQRRGAALQVHGEPPTGISAISFVGPLAACFQGAAGVVSVSFEDKAGEKAVRSKGVFMLAEGPFGLMLADAKKRVMLEMDTKSFQTRALQRFDKDERPLYFDAEAKELVTWNETKRGLVFYDNGKSTRRLAITKGHRVLQQGKRFAAAALHLDENVIEIRELPKWTGEDAKDATYKIKVPPAYTVTSAGVSINFDKKQALVYGANFLAKQRWQRVFVYDYGKGEELIGAVPVTGNQYLNFAGIDPTGSFAIIEASDITTRRTVGLKIFDFAKKSFQDIVLK